jgi:TonB family protein
LTKALPVPKVEEFKPPDVKVSPQPKLITESARDNLRPPEPPEEVKTNVFSAAESSAQPPVNLPARQVQTGGFGDPNGIRQDTRPAKEVNIGALGSFDLPAAAGGGNGSGGAKGVSGVVASAGFGSGIATSSSPAGSGGKGAVQSGVFADAAAAPAGGNPSGERKRQAEAAQTAVEITYKPRPDYTAEARQAKIEGDVLLRVLFSAAGQVKVIGVLRGLGHGLDETAVRAAEQIKFKPAVREGSAVDSTATIRILFQLAY